MALGDELNTFNSLVPGLRLATTPARVCTASGAVHQNNVNLARTDGITRSEQFYKWQLVHGLVQSGLIDAELIGTELSVPRGSKGSSSLYIDVVLFSDSSWASIYDELIGGKASTRSWDDLLALIVGCGEIKDDPADDPEVTIARQLVPALNSVGVPYALGFYYNAGHLVLMSRTLDSGGASLDRLDPVKQGTGTGVRALTPAVPDTYSLFPSIDLIVSRGQGTGAATRSGRRIGDLDITSSRSQGVVKAALESIIRTLDQVSMGSEVGYRVVVETLAAKIHDEKRSRDTGVPLDFYVDSSERITGKTITKDVRPFKDRMAALHADAQAAYPGILSSSSISFSNPAHLRIVTEVVQGFQDISFLNSTVSDLYQVVFYNFAAPLSKAQQAQFVTPLQIIDFMVRLVGPRRGEDVCDPTMGIADFLAETFRYRAGMLQADKAGGTVTGGLALGEDDRLFGVDNDANMRMLAALNMLLNGDGKAHLIHEPDTGSLDHKIVLSAATNTVQTYQLDPDDHARGNWDVDPSSGFNLLHFDVVLTNPPFGDQRALKLNDPAQGTQNKALAKLYEISTNVGGNQIDRGLLFLENAVRILKEGGRFAIILSTSLAGVKEYEQARSWLLESVRVVAVFDLPENIFAETGVPTTIICGYKPNAKRLRELQALPYEVYTRRIQRVGFFKATRKRTALLLPKYLIDPTTGVVAHEANTGAPMLDQEFDDVVDDFDSWVKTQEPELQAAFRRGP